ncbi:MAG TPA: YkgJ family cysteine cluster protein [Spirochaetota bacterium]|nr:YkgJ family cysteine cluster protein [Spirochaetota bacterium]HPI90449.1 YkgJ family cysteine cluster protein [Spirochaetota bacterium]HPR49358.1 YkgJ family cysteine cluster protein [Spirochaetota bacterium]
MKCRKCGACCIAPSITGPLPGMPSGKPAGIRCANLMKDNTCAVYAVRPPVCRNYTPTPELCGTSYQDAMLRLLDLESQTGNA